MKHGLRKLLLLLILLIPGFAVADIAVLIHGYHSSGSIWRYKGITSLLMSRGWQDAGDYLPDGRVIFYGSSLSDTGNYLITVELPSEAPIEIQAAQLSQYLNALTEQYPQQKLHLIAHSAGGIVARLALVNDYAAQHKYNVAQLITIATPHLGSPIANMADRASDTPIGFFAPIIGADEINRAEILYKQLGNEDKNHFLFWLNRQPHPPMHYTSIIRADGSILDGDWLVPPLSQNMAFVPAIGAKARIIPTPGEHELKYADGLVLLNLLP